jgi:hypothetical protein
MRKGFGNLPSPYKNKPGSGLLDAFPIEATLALVDLGLRRESLRDAEINRSAVHGPLCFPRSLSAAGLALSTAKPTALSRRRHKPSGIGVPERVHFTEF